MDAVSSLMDLRGGGGGGGGMMESIKLERAIAIYPVQNQILWLDPEIFANILFHTNEGVQYCVFKERNSYTAVVKLSKNSATVRPSSTLYRCQHDCTEGCVPISDRIRFYHACGELESKHLECEFMV